MGTIRAKYAACCLSPLPSTDPCTPRIDVTMHELDSAMLYIPPASRLAALPRAQIVIDTDLELVGLQLRRGTAAFTALLAKDLGVAGSVAARATMVVRECDAATASAIASRDAYVSAPIPISNPLIPSRYRKLARWSTQSATPAEERDNCEVQPVPSPPLPAVRPWPCDTILYIILTVPRIGMNDVTCTEPEQWMLLDALYDRPKRTTYMAQNQTGNQSRAIECPRTTMRIESLASLDRDIHAAALDRRHLPAPNADDADDAFPPSLTPLLPRCRGFVRTDLSPCDPRLNTDPHNAVLQPPGTCCPRPCRFNALGSSNALRSPPRRTSSSPPKQTSQGVAKVLTLPCSCDDPNTPSLGKACQISVDYEMYFYSCPSSLRWTSTDRRDSTIPRAQSSSGGYRMDR